MTSAVAVKKPKKLRIGFYTSSSGTIRSNSVAKAAIDSLYSTCVNVTNNHFDTTYKNKKLKIAFINKDTNAKYYFGYMSCSREEYLLPYLGDEHWKEHNIPLDDKKYIVERTYFLYYYESDILILTQNHLGPKESDLAYLLYSQSGQPGNNFSFQAIWKKESIKELLETGSTLRSCELILAAPRNFDVTNYQLDSSFSKELLNMMIGLGGTHLKINLRGRASGRVKVKGYLSDVVKDGIKELLEKIPNIVKKAAVTQPKNTAEQSLLEQVLISEKNIHTVNGYGTDSDVLQAMISAKIDNNGYLMQYDISIKKV
ncbi:DUF6731 family protein [Escherichia coli]